MAIFPYPAIVLAVRKWNQNQSQGKRREYIQLVFRTEHFRRIINGMVSGTSGRKRVQPDDLEDVEIPLPSLLEQNSIVARWRKAQDDIAAAHERVEKRKTAIDVRFFAELGLRSPAQDSVPKAFAVWWQDFLRWGSVSTTFTRAVPT